MIRSYLFTANGFFPVFNIHRGTDHLFFFFFLNKQKSETLNVLNCKDYGM